MAKKLYAELELNNEPKKLKTIIIANPKAGLIKDEATAVMQKFVDGHSFRYSLGADGNLFPGV